MPKRSSKRQKRRPRDPNAPATEMVAEATAEKADGEHTEEADAPKEASHADSKNPNAVALGRLGGMIGGKARAKKLSARRRREIARKAAEARWKKND